VTEKFDRLQEIVDAARERGLVVRALGGVGIHFHARGTPAQLRQLDEKTDLDLATRGRHSDGVEKLLAELGYLPHVEFNALFGNKRLLFYGADFPQIDVFVDRFTMCHELHLAKRLDGNDYTLRPVDLALTKLQVHELTRKDALDVLSLMLALEPGPDGLDPDELAAALADDWGFTTTVCDNLEHLQADAADYVPPSLLEAAAARLEGLRTAIDRAPKSMRWKMRARVGRRMPWYELPEENEFANIG
jgi:hypothetical protein